MRVGVIAGGGPLPVAVVQGARQAGHAARVAQIAGEGDPARFPTGSDVQSFPVAAFGAYTRWFKSEGVTHICLAGTVSRPDFASLKPDMKGLKYLPRVVRAARDGDDALLRALIGALEAESFMVIPPQDLVANLLAREGVLGRVEVPPGARGDILKACTVAREMGRLDIGQAAVVCDGVVLAVEAQEGTAAMIARVAELPEALRGTPDLRNGVLAKMLKPGQDARVDLPTLGPDTVSACDRAGIAGIVVEAGRAFILDRAEVIARAEAAGIFLLVLPEA